MSGLKIAAPISALITILVVGFNLMTHRSMVNGAYVFWGCLGWIGASYYIIKQGEARPSDIAVGSLGVGMVAIGLLT